MVRLYERDNVRERLEPRQKMRETPVCTTIRIDLAVDGGKCHDDATRVRLDGFRQRRRICMPNDVRQQLDTAKWTLLALFCVAVFAGELIAQCPVRNPDEDLPPELPTITSSTRHGEPRIPESGYLTNTSYASTYFGFVMDLPIPVDGHRIMMPLMSPGQHALLGLGFQQGRRTGTLLITASEPNNFFPEMSEEERKGEFQAWAKSQAWSQQQTHPPDWLMRTGKFYHIAKHKGDMTTVQYWTFIKNYLIRVKVASNDASFLRKSKEVLDGIKFYCAQEDGTLINEQGEIIPTLGEGYQGPTIPTSVVDAALSDKPALEQIVRGEIAPGTYRNDELGMTYTYPTTWEATQGDPDPPAKDTVATQRTRDALDACSLTLLRLTAPTGDAPNAAVRAITLRAIDQTCLGLPAPASVTDHFGAEELGAYLNMLGATGELRWTNVASREGHVFAEYSGVLGPHAQGQPLGQRQNEAVAVTRHRKLLLVWSWFAPNLAELAAMPKTSVSFEDAPPVELVPAAVLAKR